MKKEIEKLLSRAVKKLLENTEGVVFDLAEIRVDQTKDEKFGDYTSNVAMILAGKMKKNPMEIAENIAILLNCYIVENAEFEKVEVAQPGYLNFSLSEKYLQNLVLQINSEKNEFGNSQIGKGIAVNNEFISANPTGPLHLGNGRGGFYGDCLSRILRKTGFEVVNEYYVNDAGEQIIKLGHSVLKDEQAVYAGEYIDSLHAQLSVLEEKAQRLASIEGKDFADQNVYISFVGFVVAQDILNNIIKPLVESKMQISAMEYFSEKDLYLRVGEKSYVEKAIEILQTKGLTFEQEGALWLKTTQFGDDKDRVLIKSDGQKTYFASDCGYLLNKIERGFSRIIESWGADHHGYVARFEAAARALGFAGELKFLIVQLVKLVKDGKEVRMSKRAGNVVYLDDLIDEIGHDVVRFFFLMYCPDTHLNFDLGLAKERSAKNPVFYVQYAHARICSILEKATNDIQYTMYNIQNAKLELLTAESELSLIKELNKFRSLLEEIAGDYGVHKLPHYAIKLADKFHSFYAACKVIDEQNPELSSARLALVGAVKIVLAQTLTLIGVGAPEKM